jgi:hypothetical protein
MRPTDPHTYDYIVPGWRIIRQPVQIEGYSVTLPEKPLLPREQEFVAAQLRCLREGYPNISFHIKIDVSSPFPNIKDNVDGMSVFLRITATPVQGLTRATEWFDEGRAE